MNFATAIGFIISILVFVISVFTSTKSYAIFANMHAFLIIIGGTTAVAMICFPIEKIFALLRVFVKRIFGKNRRDHIGIIGEIVALSTAYRQGKLPFEAQIKRTTDYFLRDAAGILVWGSMDVPENEIRELLEKRAQTHFEHYSDEAKIFKTLSKFPPSFGLMGTTLAMIALLQSLGADDAKARIGPAMAIGLVATLYGIVLSNFLFIPIAENLGKQAKEDLTCRKIVVEGIMLIYRGFPTRFVEEKVKSFLLPSERGEAGYRNVKA